MNKVLGPLFLFLCLLIHGHAVASETLEDTVADILKLDMSHDEVADSAFSYIYMYDVNHRGEAYAACEEAYATQLIPYCERNKVDKWQLARYYDELGQMQIRQGKSRVNDAKSSYEKALKCAEESKHYYRKGRILEHCSLVETKYGDIAKGFELAQKAIEAYKMSDTDVDRYITRCYYAQAITYLQLNDTDGLAKLIDNMKAFTKSVRPENLNFLLYNLYSVEEAYYGTLYESAKGGDRKRYADLFNQVSLKTIRLLESFDSDEWKITSINPVWNYYNRGVMFVNFYDRPPMDSVKYYIDKALAIDFDNKADDINEIHLSAAQLLAEAWMKNNNYPKAKEILFEAIGLLQETEGMNGIIIDKIEIYKGLKDIASQSHEYEDALAYSDSINALERQKYSLQQAETVKDLEIKYQTKETELALSQSEGRRAATLMWLFAVAGLLLLAIIVFVLYANRQYRRRMQKEIEFANLRADIGRQLTKQYIEGLENERERMSRELHDGVCNDLLAIEMQINGGKSVENTVKLIGECREAVRRISHELMPPEFAYATLDEVVRFYISKQAEANAGRMSLTYSSGTKDAGWGDVPDSVALEVYRIIQESVGNAIKHSGASEVGVNLNLDGKLLTAIVRDNGIYKRNREKGVGLESIRKRANSIKGDMTFETDEMSGTTMRFSVKI